MLKITFSKTIFCRKAQSYAYIAKLFSVVALILAHGLQNGFVEQNAVIVTFNLVPNFASLRLYLRLQMSNYGRRNLRSNLRFRKLFSVVTPKVMRVLQNGLFQRKGEIVSFLLVSNFTRLRSY